MKISTTRFGAVEFGPDDVLQFPGGLPGLEACTSWVLLADEQNSALGWLQSTSDPAVALAVVSPRRFVPEYQLRVTRGELGSILCPLVNEVRVLAIVSVHEGAITLNLKAPLVIHLGERIGRQVIASGEAPVQYELGLKASPRKKIA
jgi:flagellar assembly factor FliW